MNGTELGIYIHIPFCIRKCAYCDFLSFPAGEELREEYVKALCREIESWNTGGKTWLAGLRRESSRTDSSPPRVVSIFFGGGTPSLLEPGQIAGILEAVRKSFACSQHTEITMECNPGTLSDAKLRALREMGINRLSIGLQSASDTELKRLGRIHDLKTFEENYHAARDAGFTNINVDLMSALPGQTVQDWESTLARVVSLDPPPEHISAYSLIIEEGTPFYAMYGEEGDCRGQLPSEEDERRMYRLTRDFLEPCGYHRYEISNYALEGYECIHNLGYWKRRDYLGFGLGAASCMDQIRWSNTRDMETYLRSFGQSGYVSDRARTQTQVLSRQEQIEECVFLGLRMTKGIDLEAFLREFGIGFRDLFGKKIEKLEKAGLLRICGGYARVTDEGFDLEGYVERELLT